MESLERKDGIVVVEDPIKSEDMVPSPSTSDRSTGAGSPPPNCSICLGKLINTSFTDSCLHKFCFTCLLQWSKIKTECPLCKQTFKSIIHNVRSEGDYDQYDVNLQAVRATLDVAVGFPAPQWEVIRAINISPLATPPRAGFMYSRTTMAPNNRRYNPLLNADAVARREQIPAHLPQVSREESRRRTTDPTDFRRQVYRQGIWAAELPDAFGRLRESSAEYYRRHPGETHRLVSWLNRELQVLLNNNNNHIAYVMSKIMETIVVYDINTPEFRNVVRPYFGIHTDQFVHEFANYARSNFDMTGYDQSVVYHPLNRGFSNAYVHRTISPSSSSFDSDSDSDVRLVEDDDVSNRRAGLNTLSVGPHMIDMPGPSTVGQALRLTTPRIVIAPLVPPVCYTISSTSESENECEVIGYVKPRHERTPEIIDLNSDDEHIIPGPSTSQAPEPIEIPLTIEEELVVPGPSHEIDLNLSRRTRYPADDASKCCLYEYFSSTSEDDVDESDSDYNPQSKRRRKKKSSKSSPRKARSKSKRKKSTGTPRKRDKSRRAAADDDSEDAPSTSRGTKRRNDSDDSDAEKPAKKSKKSKKAKSSKKSKKSKAKSPRYIEYSSCTSSMSSDSEAESSRTPVQKRDLFDYSGMEEKEEEKQPRYAESECSSRLRIDEDNSQSSDDGDDDDEDYDYDYSQRTLKSVVTTATRDEDSHDDSESEHSASTKTSRGRCRSHKKRSKDGSKRRRRSRS